eukprot:UN13903
MCGILLDKLVNNGSLKTKWEQMRPKGRPEENSFTLSVYFIFTTVQCKEV